MNKKDLSKGHVLFDMDTTKNEYHPGAIELGLVRSGIAKILGTTEIETSSKINDEMKKKAKNPILMTNADLEIFNKPNGNIEFRSMVKAYGFEIKGVFDLNGENIDSEINHRAWNEANEKRKQ